MPEDLGIVARAGEADGRCDLGDGQLWAAEQGKALLDAVVQEEIKGRLVQRGLEQAAEFALVCVARRDHLVERDRLIVVLIDEVQRVFQPLDAHRLRRDKIDAWACHCSALSTRSRACFEKKEGTAWQTKDTSLNCGTS